MIFFYRKKGMSFEDFNNYWHETHAKVACDLPIFKKNILKYEQISDLVELWTLDYRIADQRLAIDTY